MKKSKFYSEMVSRNIGVVSSGEQEKLRKSCVAVAGCGGMGGVSAEQLVRMGVGHIKIADFDNFEVHNLSRQSTSTTSTVGKKKATILGRYLKDINPELKLEIFEKGVHRDNVDEFTEDADVAIDGIDYNSFYNAVLLGKSAKRNNICVVSPLAIAFGVSVFVFGPKTQSLAEYAGLPSNASDEKIKKFKIPPEKSAPYMPSYVNYKKARFFAFLKMNIPNIIMPQHLGGGIAVSEAVMMLLGRVKPPTGPEPRIFVFDIQDRKFEVTG
ncbi:ThiF family adenylyltransferase [Candidatus Omnitrophota bacterium]